MSSVLRFCGLLLLATPVLAFGQAPATRGAESTKASSAATVAHADRPHVKATARTGAIKIDGSLDEAVWATAPVATNFTQQDPNEGKPATQQTEIRFVYDDDALYIGARMYDDKGAQGIRTRLVRRDQIQEGDYLQFVFDTYHDH